MKIFLVSWWSQACLINGTQRCHSLPIEYLESREHLYVDNEDHLYHSKLTNQMTWDISKLGTVFLSCYQILMPASSIQKVFSHSFFYHCQSFWLFHPKLQSFGTIRRHLKTRLKLYIYQKCSIMYVMWNFQASSLNVTMSPGLVILDLEYNWNNLVNWKMLSLGYWTKYSFWQFHICYTINNMCL